jgi:threonine dehydratase
MARFSVREYCTEIEGREIMKSNTMIKRILTAPVYDVARETPIDPMSFLSKRLHNQIQVKREDLQPAFSFKLRGAYTCMVRLSPEQKKNGVVAASAGNHAQGVAIAAAKIGIASTIFMPVTTPEIKVRGVRKLGGRFAKVILEGDRFDDACAQALEFARREKQTFIHPYDDTDIISGQGTIGMEILRQRPTDLHAVFVPVGGGGLLAGVITYIKYLRPDVRVIGVEADESACLKAALDAGRRVKLAHTGIFADGVSVAQIGKRPFSMIRDKVDDVITVTTDEICAAIKDLFDDTRSVAEPSGALALAGLKKYVRTKRIKNKSLVAIVSGANSNFDRLRFVAERHAVGEKREVLLGVTIPEKPGSLLDLCRCAKGHDVTEFNYRYDNAAKANVFLGIKVRDDGPDRERLIKRLRKQGFALRDLSGNALAKLHVCHMVGGHSRRIPEEVYRFEFPERAGILEHFLTVMRGRWNVSLFQYRQHGGTYAHVLVGLQEIPGTKHKIDTFLKELAFPYVRETDNPAYRMFLGD